MIIVIFFLCQLCIFDWLGPTFILRDINNIYALIFLACQSIDRFKWKRLKTDFHYSVYTFFRNVNAFIIQEYLNVLLIILVILKEETANNTLTNTIKLVLVFFLFALLVWLFLVTKNDKTGEKKKKTNTRWCRKNGKNGSII